MHVCMYVCMYVPYCEKFSRDKIFAVFADLPQTAKILTAKFLRSSCFVLCDRRTAKIFHEIFASGQSAKILSCENFSPYGMYVCWMLPSNQIFKLA